MLLTEEQTKYYLNDMIQHYGEKEKDSQQLSWNRSEADAKRKAFEDMRIVLFGDDNNGHRNTTT
tara:strand:+ start:105 stop:296 length:192 start_codon:yes stop_codon:yes gene_type:complete